MKKLCCMLLTTIMVFGLAVSVAANGIVADSNAILLMESNEEKVYCTATVEDSFEDDCVLVVIDHVNSMRDIPFTPAHFPGIDVKSVTSLTSPIQPLFTDSTTTEEAGSCLF